MMRAPALAELAIRYGREHQIDPTHVVLNCAHNNKEIFALCVSAANRIAAGRSDQSILTQAAHDYLIEGLSPDNEYLLRNLIA
ncbi:hypothetical protein D9M71_782550 [compost metagenome]